MIDYTRGVYSSGQYRRVYKDGLWCNLSQNEYPDDWAAVESYLVEHPSAIQPEPIPASPTTEDWESAARRYRDVVLQRTVDRYNAPRWEAMTEAERQAVRDYRQALLDWPESDGFPDISTLPKL